MVGPWPSLLGVPNGDGLKARPLCGLRSARVATFEAGHMGRRRPRALTNRQLRSLYCAASLLEPHQRSPFLRAVADRLEPPRLTSTRPSTWCWRVSPMMRPPDDRAPPNSLGNREAIAYTATGAVR